MGIENQSAQKSSYNRVAHQGELTVFMQNDQGKRIHVLGKNSNNELVSSRLYEDLQDGTGQNKSHVALMNAQAAAEAVLAEFESMTATAQAKYLKDNKIKVAPTGEAVFPAFFTVKLINKEGMSDDDLAVIRAV